MIPQLADIARLYVGIKETSANSGPMIEEFQKAVDGKAHGEPWCLAFVQYCVKKLDKDLGTKNWLHNTEHVLTLWNLTHKKCRLSGPEIGSIICWQKYNNGVSTLNGHCGIVVAIPNDFVVETVEGNTSDEIGINRDGDGVFQKRRQKWGNESFRVLGYLDPWPIIDPKVRPFPVVK